jgi:Flp pilus assembly pilin Flp
VVRGTEKLRGGEYMLNTLIAYLTVAVMNVREREEGQTLVEYALIIALVSVLLIASLTGLKNGIAGVFTDIVGAF